MKAVIISRDSDISWSIETRGGMGTWVEKRGGGQFKDYILMRNNSSGKWKKWWSISKSNKINTVWPLKYVLYILLAMRFIIYTLLSNEVETYCSFFGFFLYSLPWICPKQIWEISMHSHWFLWTSRPSCLDVLLSLWIFKMATLSLWKRFKYENKNIKISY